MSLNSEKFLGDRNYAIGKTLFAGSIVLSLLAIFLLTKVVTEVIAWTQVNEGDYAENTINVSGEGEVVSIPDVATFSFSVNVTSEDVETAQNESAKKMNDALGYLTGEGVDEKDVKTTSYNAYPKYQYIPCRDFDCGETQKLIGYEVSQNISVTVRDTDNAGTILSGIGSRGATNISGLSFEIDDPSKLEEEARSLAIDDARERAERLAEDLGVKLKGVVSFNEDQGYYPEPYYAKTRALGGIAEDSAVAPELPIGENTVRKTVNITYEIR